MQSERVISISISIATHLNFYVFDVFDFLYFYHCGTKTQIDSYGAESFWNMKIRTQVFNHIQDVNILRWDTWIWSLKYINFDSPYLL